jgi:hypothetical protein
MRSKLLIAAAMVGLVVGLLSVVTASAASINVTPKQVPVGGKVTISGDVLGPNGQPACQVPGTVTLISGAFAGQGTFQHQDVETTVGADGKYTVQAQILSGVAPGTYTVTGRCGGGNLGVQATLVVTSPGLPATGSGPTADSPAAGLPGGYLPVGAAVILLTLGLVAVIWWARPVASSR